MSDVVDAASSFNATYSSYKSRDDNFQKFSEILNKSENNLDPHVVEYLRTAESCLSLGTGTGKLEVEFIKKLMPNLHSLTAVESDAASVLELKLNFQRHLPDVVLVVLEKSVEECGDVIEGKFNVVLLFSILVLTDPDYHDTLCKTLLLKWTLPDGVVVYSQFNRDDNPRSFSRILSQLNPDYQVPSYEYFEQKIIGGESSVEQQRFRHETHLDVQYSQDLSNPDAAVIQMFGRLVHKDIDIDEARRVIYDTWPGGKTNDKFMRFGFYRKILG